MRRTIRLMVILLGFLGSSGSAFTQATPPQDLSLLLQGTWQAVRIVAEGETGPKEVTEAVKWNFEGKKYKGMGPEMDFHGQFALKSANRFNQIDLIPEGGKPPMQGIFELKGDQLTLCVGKPRPTDFQSKEDDGKVVYILKKVKK